MPDKWQTRAARSHQIIAITVATHLKYFKIHIALLLIFCMCSCEETSTPKQYLNKTKIAQSVYKKDKISLVHLTANRQDSLRKTSKTPKGKSLEIYIDTIFYSPENKIVFLSITKRENKYALNVEGISFAGECFIGTKELESNKIKILDRLKYGATSGELDGFERVQKSIRNIYLNEMEFIEGRFNINDTRFWSSNVWLKK